MKISVKDYFNGVFSRDGAPPEADLARAEFIREHIPEGVRTILEVGAGSGIVSRVIAEEYTVTCVDLSTVAVAKLAELGMTCRQGNIAELPFPDKSFDLVIVSEVLEHLDQEIFSRGLAEITRVASGYVLITVPNKEWYPLLRQECPHCRTISVPWTHIRRFDVGTVRQLVDSFGFTCIQVQSFGLLVVDKSSLIGRLLMWHRGFYNFLRPGMTCPICKYEQPGRPLRRPLLGNFATRPLATCKYVLDRLSNKLSPKCHRWIFAVYSKG